MIRLPPRSNRTGRLVPNTTLFRFAMRSPSCPDVPTAAEAGLPDYEVSTWYAMLAPDGTPADIVKKMSEDLVKALNAPKVKELWTSNGSATPNMTGEAFGKFVDAEIIRWGEVAKQAKVQPQ